jgi:microcin C transport system ATP-binding protein
MADRVCVMQNGRIVETGPVGRIFANPQHDYTKMLLAAEPKGQPPKAETHANVVLEAQDLKVWFPVKRGFLRRTVGHVKAVDGVDLTVREGQTLGVVGESGSGKTTLGLAMLRLVSSQGRIAYAGTASTATMPRRCGRCASRCRSCSRTLRLAQPAALGAPDRRGGAAGARQGDRCAERERRVAGALEEVGLDPALMERYPHEFSGGQRQRIAIARAMALTPQFVMLDEPTSALDMSVQAQIVDLLRELQQRHGWPICSSATISRWCARSPTRSWSCATASWSSRDRPRRCSSGPEPTTPRR